jgi:hypothetical protein
MHQGIKSIALDGKEYRSDLEKSFVNKFLFEKYHYEYENSYQDGSKRTCDFYIPLFKLWIEVVPFSADLYAKGKIVKVPEKIYLNVDYHDREKVKNNGARWDKEKSKWYILQILHAQYRGSPSLCRFLPNDSTYGYINEDRPEFKHFREYNRNISEKASHVHSLGELFCTVHPEDLGCDTLMHILQVRGFDGWKFIRIAEQVKFDKIDKLVTEEINRREKLISVKPNEPPRKKFKKRKNKNPEWIAKMNDTERLNRLKKFKESKKGNP